MLKRPLTPYCVATLLVAALAAEGAFADSFQNASTASKDSAEASARLAVSGVQITLGAVAIPLEAIGGLTAEAGDSVAWLSGQLWDAANEPLTITEDVLTAVPPPVLSAPGPAREE